MNNKKIAIIGGGASGLFSSILLSKVGFDVTIYEKNNKVGKKLLATGNGRCNITNSSIKLSNFHTNSNINNIESILKDFDFKSCKRFFNSIGIEFKVNENNRVYPYSQTASSVVEALEFEAVKNGVKIKLNSEVESIDYTKNSFIINNQDRYNKVIISTGSVAMKKLGSSQSGYDFGKKFGHNIVKLFPSLVQLVTTNKNLEMVSGVKIEAKINNKSGDLLFTKYGISGSLVLDISREISKKLQTTKSIELTADLLPSYTKDRLKELLENRAKQLQSKEINIWLDGLFPKKLAKFIIHNSSLPSHIKYPSFLTSKDIDKIINTIKYFKFFITDTKGFENAEVCGGGVSLDQIDLNSMESKLQKDLFFIGEVVDIDGDCGGYNLHWGWASGFRLASCLTQKF